MDAIRKILLLQPSDDVVRVFGWVQAARLQRRGTLLFLEINDGSCADTLQVVASIDAVPDLAPLTPRGTGLGLEGRVVEAPAKATQRVEFHVSSVIHVGACPDGFPVPAESIKDGRVVRASMSLERLRAIPHLRLRSRALASVQRIRSTLTLATHVFFQGEDFLQAHTPVITASDCEGAGQLFSIGATITGPDGAKRGFFGGPAYTTVSGQLEGEQMAIGLGRIYTFGPTFRAENSNTSRHLAEFWMVEPEMCFYQLDDLMGNAERYVKSCLEAVVAGRADDLTILGVDLADLIARPFIRMSYTEAVTKVHPPAEWGDDLTSDQERHLVEQVCGSTPVIVYNYPAAIKSFYMKVNPDGRTVQAMDVLVPGIGELIGGSVREDSLEVLESRMAACGLDPAQYADYLDTRRFGSVPHAGYGLGFERLVMLATGMRNIRDTIPFPRYPGAFA